MASASFASTACAKFLCWLAKRNSLSAGVPLTAVAIFSMLSVCSIFDSKLNVVNERFLNSTSPHSTPKSSLMDDAAKHAYSIVVFVANAAMTALRSSSFALCHEPSPVIL